MFGGGCVFVIWGGGGRVLTSLLGGEQGMGVLRVSGGRFYVGCGVCVGIVWLAEREPPLLGTSELQASDRPLPHKAK